MQRHLEDLRQCYERRLLVHPWLTGKVVVHCNITTTGEVSEPCVTEDSLGDAEVLACVNRLGADARFPAPRGGPVDVSFPFVFGATR